MGTIKESETECGTGCDCSKSSFGNKTKIIIGSVVALVAMGIFAYKLIKQPPAAAVNNANAYSSMANETSMKVSAEKPKNPVVESKQTSKKVYIGEYLDSFGSLNTVAIKHDGVFILVQEKGNEAVKNEIETAMLGAQSTLKDKDIKIGLYTLRTSVQDYQGIIKQVKPPVIVVACKGRGMGAVPGDSTEERLLQAFVSASQAGGGCGPSSGCGPSTPGCK